MKKTKKFFSVAVIFALAVTLLSACSWRDIAGLVSETKSLQEKLVGVAYNMEFYDNYGNLSMTAEGENVSLTENIIEVPDVDADGNVTTTYELSSVITITMDGNELENCGNTVIFAEKGLEKDVDFSLEDIKSEADGLSDVSSVARLVNRYKNFFGKSRVVVIQSQLGTPICAYSGEDVYFELCDNMPKTTKLVIDGKVLYIHRANYILQDKKEL